MWQQRPVREEERRMSGIETRSRRRAIVITSVLAIGLWPSIGLARKPQGAITEGQELFNRRFVPGRGLPPGGDGLGPMFNHTSCAGCHVQGGVGGGGPIDVKVRLLSAQLANSGNRPATKTLIATLRSLHPAFVATDDKITPTIILHRFGADARYAEARRFFAPDVPLEPTSKERDE